MGGGLSDLQNKHKRDLLSLLSPHGHNQVMSPLIDQLLHEISRVASFFPEEGTLDLEKWDRVGLVLSKSDQPSVQILHTWRLCRSAVAKVANPLLQLQDASSASPRILPPSQPSGLEGDFALKAVSIPSASLLSADSSVPRSVLGEMPPFFSLSSCPEAIPQISVQQLAREGNSDEIMEVLPLMANLPNEQTVMVKSQELPVIPLIFSAREQQEAADDSFLNADESKPLLRKLSSPDFTELPISVNVSKAKDFFPVLNEQVCIVKDGLQEMFDGTTLLCSSANEQFWSAAKDSRVFLSVSNELTGIAKKLLQEVFEFSTFQSNLEKGFSPEKLCLASVSRNSDEIAAYEPD